MFGTLDDIIYLIDPVLFAIIMAVLIGLLLVAVFYPYIERRLARPDRVSASVVGFFAQVDDAVRGVRRLREAGFSGDNVTVLSSIPYPEGAFETDTGRSWIRPFALAGGILGALFGSFLVAGTALAYPLPTGGKPIVPIPTMLIITYELTVLTVMLFALFRFLFEARLPGSKGRLHDPRIAGGMIGVIARCETEDQARQAEAAMATLGAEETRRVEGRVS